MAEPLIDLGTVPGSSIAEVPSPSPDALSHPDMPSISPEPDASRGSVPQATSGQPDLNDPPATSSTAPQSRKLVPAPWFFARVSAVHIGRAEFVPGKFSYRWLVLSEVVFVVMALGQVR